jgi:hypothetical protein
MSDALDPAAAAANQAYGELTAHLDDAAYAFERAMGRLLILLEGDGWMKVGAGYSHPEPFVRSLPLAQFGKVIEQRQQFVTVLKAKTAASNRAIAQAMGVSHTTIDKDAGNKLPPGEKAASEISGHVDASGNKLPPGAQAAKIAALREERRETRARRALEAAASGVTPDPTEMYRVIYADPP